MSGHRWAMRVSDEGDSAMIVVESHRGNIHIIGGSGSVTLDPRRVSRLRRVLLEAQADALQERGAW